MMEFRHELGSKVESKITGVIGAITSRSQNLYGCNRYFIQPRMGEDKKLPDGWWIDEEDVLVLETAQAPARKNVGGPMSKLK